MIERIDAVCAIIDSIDEGLGVGFVVGWWVVGGVVVVSVLKGAVVARQKRRGLRGSYKSKSFAASAAPTGARAQEQEHRGSRRSHRSKGTRARASRLAPLLQEQERLSLGGVNRCRER